MLLNICKVKIFLSQLCYMQSPVVQLVRTPILVSVYSRSMAPTWTALLKFSLLVHHRMITHDLIFIATGLEDFSPAWIQWHGTNVNSTTGHSLYRCPNTWTPRCPSIWSHCTACGNCMLCRKSLWYRKPRCHLLV